MTHHSLHWLGRSALAVAIATAGIGGVVSAADAPTHTMIKARAQLLNAEVKNRQGEKLGEIEELVVDDSGQIRYIVLSHGGFLDIGDKVIALPWARSQVALGGDNSVVMDISRADLADAPNFDKDQWPDMSSASWAQRERSFSDRYVARHDVSPPSNRVPLEQLDTDRDGHISKQEAQADPNVSQRFAQLDRNDDGKLSQWEFNTYQPPSDQASEAGQSPSEQARASLTPQQQKQRRQIAESSEQQNVTQDAKADSKASKGGGNSGKSAGQTAKKDTESPSSDQPPNERFGKLDQDSNGELDRDEAKASEQLNRVFSKVDRNSDGKIDQAEFSAFESGTIGGTDKAAGQTGPEDQAGSAGQSQQPSH